MATFKCGGKEHVVPEMNFLAIERAWPFVLEATNSLDPIVGSSAAISVIAASMFEGLDFKRSDWGISEEIPDNLAFDNLVKSIKRTLKGNELGEVQSTMMQIMEEGGLQVSVGELTEFLQKGGAGVETLLMETAENTSPSSSPQE